MKKTFVKNTDNRGKTDIIEGEIKPGKVFSISRFICQIQEQETEEKTQEVADLVLNALKKYVIILIIQVVLLSSCTQEKSNVINENSDNRIKIKEERMINGYNYLIIQVDSTEFLVSQLGGVAKL